MTIVSTCLQIKRHPITLIELFIPHELLSAVFQHLDQRNIKNVRQACKSFNAAASRFLIREVAISTSRSDLRKFHDICEHAVFRLYVTDQLYHSRMFDEALTTDIDRYTSALRALVTNDLGGRP
ncbi:hypothetical protein MMC14_002788, partial [Varicellaria rhodocarpa]|nr:hypothetical protein [Varicellaria rhodocarpa]